MAEPTTLRETIDAQMTLWALCLYCGRVHLNDPTQLAGRVQDGDDSLAAIAKTFNCLRCRRALFRLVPTPRTMVSFDRVMGAHGKY